MWLRARGAEKPKAIHWRSAAIIGILMPVFGTGVVVWSEKKVPSGIAALLVAIEPLWMRAVAVVSPRRKAAKAWVIAGVVLGLARTLSARGSRERKGKGDLFAEGDVAPGGAFVGVGSLYSKGAPQPKTNSSALGWRCSSPAWC